MRTRTRPNPARRYGEFHFQSEKAVPDSLPA
jgi:hypothetical protein